jgi:hypothetical protein
VLEHKVHLGIVKYCGKTCVWRPGQSFTRGHAWSRHDQGAAAEEEAPEEEGLRVPLDVAARVLARAQPGAARRAHETGHAEAIRPLPEGRRVVGRGRQLRGVGKEVGGRASKAKVGSEEEV